MWRRWTSVAAALAAASWTVAAAGPVAADPPVPPVFGYAQYQVTGPSGQFTGGVTLPAGFPAVTLISNSSTATVESDNSVYLPPDTPFADDFGTSAGQSYLSLAPEANSGASPSSTVYRFASPTPAGTWGVNFTDINADTLTLSATDIDGNPVLAADLGLGGVYNYCNVPLLSPRPESCPLLPIPSPIPTATVGVSAVSVTDPLCPTVGLRCTTVGESVWFRPQVPLKSLTVTSTSKQGPPTTPANYQTWFATQLSTAVGTVVSDCPLPPGTPTLTLTSDTGAVLQNTFADLGGDYSFDGLARGVKFAVAIDPAGLPASAQPGPAQTFTTTENDVLAPDLHVSVGHTVTGVVRGGQAGDEVVLTFAPGQTNTSPVQVRPVSTGGAFTFPSIRPGRYILTTRIKGGHTITPNSDTVDVGCADTTAPAFIETPTTSPTTPTTPTTSTTSTTSSTPTTTGPKSTGPIYPAVTYPYEPPHSTGSSGTLAATGVNAGPLAAAGVTLLLSGALSLALAKRYRRRRLHEEPTGGSLMTGPARMDL